jgi:hypothetical protein
MWPFHEILVEQHRTEAAMLAPSAFTWAPGWQAVGNSAPPDSQRLEKQWPEFPILERLRP